MKRHLLKKHPVEFKKASDTRSHPTDPTPTQKKLTSYFGEPGVLQIKQQYKIELLITIIVPGFYPASSAFAVKQNMALVKLICKDLQPLSVVENEGFREYSSHLNPRYKIPSRKTIRDKLIPGMNRFNL